MEYSNYHNNDELYVRPLQEKDIHRADKKIIDAILKYLILSEDHASLTKSNNKLVFFIVPSSLIIPAGYNAAVSINKNKRVVGIKVLINNDISTININQEIINLIANLTYLERIVAAPRANGLVSIPSSFAKLKNLNYLWIAGEIKSFSRDILNMNLPITVIDGNYFNDDTENNEFGNLYNTINNITLGKDEETAREKITDPYDLANSTGEWRVISNGDLTPQLQKAILDVRRITIRSNILEDPPLEIAKKGKVAIEHYFRGLDEGHLPLNELKVILVGNGGAGKTSLVKRMTGEEFNPNESQTHGINICPWILDTTDREIKINFWDFGGQEIMHATHQFFLSKRSIYILVLDGRKDEDPEYWLQHIESFGGDSPIFLVLNRIDEHPAFDVNRRFLLSKYSSLKNFFRVSCANNFGIKDLLETLSNNLETVPMLQTPWPMSWFKIKQQLENMDEPYLSLRKYKQLCESVDLKDRDDQEILMDFLHDLGAALRFKDLELLDTHVLDPRWVTEGVYRIINSELLAQQKGYIYLTQISSILEQTGHAFIYPIEKHHYIIDLMLKFELCYRIDAQAILIPDLLDIQEPIIEFSQDESLNFVFQYTYFPRSIMPRFIVRTHADIKNNRRWRTGVMLEDKDLSTTALVRADEKASRIYVSVIGDKKREYFSVLRKIINEINRSFEKLQVSELVPLPGVADLFIDYLELRGYENAGREELFVGRINRSYNVKSLLDGIEKQKSREAHVIFNVNGDYFSTPNSSIQSTALKVQIQEDLNMEYVAKTWERAIVYLSGFMFLVLVSFLLVRNEKFADPNLVVVLRIVLSLVVAVFGAAVPGMLNVDFSAKGITVRAVGALALFVLAFLLTPTVLPH